MKKITSILFAGALSCAPAFVSSQSVKPVVCQPKEAAASPVTRAGAIGDAAYLYPVALRNLGTISKEDNAVCNFLTRNRELNEGAYLWAPTGTPVSYFDNSANSPVDYKWTAPGSLEGTQETQDADVTYNTPGVYEFPTLTVQSAGGTESSYQAEGSIKVGGTAEITCSDMREWFSTYLLSYLPFSDGGGYMGGTNNKDLVGFGNLYMISQPSAFMESVNVYLPFKPTKYEEGATLRLQVWVPLMGESSLVFTYLPLNGALLPMKDIKGDGEDGAYVPIEGGAVAQFKFDQPIDLSTFPVFFISVEGFGNDPDKENFCILADQLGQYLPMEDAANLLAHNSFVRYKDENDYLRPMWSYNQLFGSFLICPVLRAVEEGSGIADTQAAKPMTARFANGALDIEATGSVQVFDLSGKLVAECEANDGKVRLNANGWSRGVYIVRDRQGNSLKVTR